MPLTMGCTLTKVESGQFFALIGFVPDALGEFLNSMRRQLVPGCPFKSHVTLLPPRVLDDSPGKLSRILGHRLLTVEPFEITLGRVQVFPASGVIYLRIENGGDVLRRIHGVLAQDEFACDETYPFHPHLTLAQDFPRPQLDEMVERARSLWKSWEGERGFMLGHASFVQGVDLCTWETVSEHELNHSQCLRTA
jgi:2'-5' RNA ligase